MIQKSKCNQYFCLLFCFFLSIYNMSFFVISVLPYVVIIHYNFFTYILHNLPHFRCHSTFFRKNGEIYPSARHPSTTSKAQTNITFLSLPLSYTVNASKRYSRIHCGSIASKTAAIPDSPRSITDIVINIPVRNRNSARKTLVTILLPNTVPSSRITISPFIRMKKIYQKYWS